MLDNVFHQLWHKPEADCVIDHDQWNQDLTATFQSSPWLSSCFNVVAVRRWTIQLNDYVIGYHQLSNVAN